MRDQDSLTTTHFSFSSNSSEIMCGPLPGGAAEKEVPPSHCEAEGAFAIWESFIAATLSFGRSNR